jgi:heme-degrading monooxygenase HmoA
MYAVHVEMKLKPGAREALEKTFVETFRPAIVEQDGFRAVNLLRPFEGDWDYRLTIAFENRELQQKWVAKDLHQDVWPRMQSHCSDCVITCYNAV